MLRRAELSECRRWRYSLERSDDFLFDAAPERTVAWIMLNPSTADETTDDLTIRKCLGFSRRWGFTGIRVVNLFAWRATDPRELRSLSLQESVGNPRNDGTILQMCAGVPLVVAAWGSLPCMLFRDRRSHMVHKLGAIDVVLRCLGRTQDGEPRHPSRLGYTARLELYNG